MMRTTLVLLSLLVFCAEASDPRKCKSSAVVASREGIAALARSLVNRTITYTQTSNRWNGISTAKCPMAEVPTYADCSSFVSWIFWTTFGEWPDYLNNQNWAAGYTGTMYAMGRDHPVSAANRQKGDVVLYGTPTVNHATLYVGDGQVVTFGVSEGITSPINLRSINYRSDMNGTYRYADFFAIGTSCTQSTGETGTCIDVDVTPCNGVVETGRCDGPSAVRCCVTTDPSSSSITGGGGGGGGDDGGDDSASAASTLHYVAGTMAAAIATMQL